MNAINWSLRVIFLATIFTGLPTIGSLRAQENSAQNLPEKSNGHSMLTPITTTKSEKNLLAPIVKPASDKNAGGNSDPSAGAKKATIADAKDTAPNATPTVNGGLPKVPLQVAKPIVSTARDLPPIDSDAKSTQGSGDAADADASKIIQNKFVSQPFQMQPVVQSAATNTPSTTNVHTVGHVEQVAGSNDAKPATADNESSTPPNVAPFQTRDAFRSPTVNVADRQLPAGDQVELTVGKTRSDLQSQGENNTGKREVKDFPSIDVQPTVVAARKHAVADQLNSSIENGMIQNTSATEQPPVPFVQDEKSPSDRTLPNLRYPNPDAVNPGLIRPGFRLGPDGRLIPDPTFQGDPRLTDPQFRQQLNLAPDAQVTPGTNVPGQMDPFNNNFTDVPQDFMNQGSLDGFSDCGFSCGASQYGILEYLYFDRDNGVITAANFRPARFEDAMGLRITLGEKYDSFSGREFVYQGFDPWGGSSQRTSNSQLFTLLVPSNGITLNSINHLRFGNWMEQFQKTDLHSVEFNRVRWYWDVAKSFWGIRYIYLQDEYRLSSSNFFNQSGTYDIETENHMIGLQWGTSLAYDIGCRLSLSGWAKIGGYLNFSEGSIGLNNTGVQVLDNGTDRSDFAATFELGAVAHYQIGPRARLRAGYEVLQFYDVMTASQNYTGTITGLSGLNMRNDARQLFDGVSLGFEFFR
jgi:hypothetical protein